MLKIIRTLIIFLIPLIFVSASIIYFGNEKYLEELRHENDKADAQRWAFLYGLGFSPIGLVFGGLISALIYTLFEDCITRKNKSS